MTFFVNHLLLVSNQSIILQTRLLFHHEYCLLIGSRSLFRFPLCGAQHACNCCSMLLLLPCWILNFFMKNVYFWCSLCTCSPICWSFRQLRKRSVSKRYRLACTFLSLSRSSLMQSFLYCSNAAYSTRWPSFMRITENCCALWSQPSLLDQSRSWPLYPTYHPLSSRCFQCTQCSQSSLVLVRPQL